MAQYVLSPKSFFDQDISEWKTEYFVKSDFDLSKLNWSEKE